MTEVRVPDADRIGDVGRGLAGGHDHPVQRAHHHRRRRRASRPRARAPSPRPSASGTTSRATTTRPRPRTASCSCGSRPRRCASPTSAPARTAASATPGPRARSPSSCSPRSTSASTTCASSCSAPTRSIDYDYTDRRSRAARPGRSARVVAQDVPAVAGQLHRGRHVGDPAQHPRRARARPARRAPHRQGPALVPGAPQLSCALARTGSDLRTCQVRRSLPVGGRRRHRSGQGRAGSLTAWPATSSTSRGCCGCGCSMPTARRSGRSPTSCSGRSTGARRRAARARLRRAGAPPGDLRRRRRGSAGPTPGACRWSPARSTSASSGCDPTSCWPPRCWAATEGGETIRDIGLTPIRPAGPRLGGGHGGAAPRRPARLRRAVPGGRLARGRRACSTPGRCPTGSATSGGMHPSDAARQIVACPPRSGPP